MCMSFARQLGVFFLVFGLMGCAGTSIKSDANVDPREVVAKRFQSRWDALIKGDLDTAYTYLSPGARSTMSLELYKAKLRPGLWNKVSLDSVDCKGWRCDIVYMLDYRYRDMKSIVTRQTEVWLESEGVWWYVPNPDAK